jgi:hypothetical protein
VRVERLYQHRCPLLLEVLVPTDAFAGLPRVLFLILYCLNMIFKQYKMIFKQYKLFFKHFRIALKCLTVALKHLIIALKCLIAALKCLTVALKCLTVALKCLREVFNTSTEGIAALPGCSEHETGLAFDVGATNSPDSDILKKPSAV